MEVRERIRIRKRGRDRIREMRRACRRRGGEKGLGKQCLETETRKKHELRKNERYNIRKMGDRERTRIRKRGRESGGSTNYKRCFLVDPPFPEKLRISSNNFIMCKVYLYSYQEK